MADRPKDDAKGKETIPRLTSTTEIQSPIDLPELNTPNAALSSSKFSLRNSTSRWTATDQKDASKTSPSLHNTTPSQYRMSDLEPWTLSPNIRDQQKHEPSGKPSKTTRTVGIARAIEAGKRLQRVMGVAEPVPFVTPPAVPENLEQEFVAGMKEYGLENKMHNMALDVLSQVAGMQERLPEIEEENESPVKAAWTPPKSDQEEGASDDPLDCLADVQSTPSKGPKKPVGNGIDDQQPPALAPSSRMSHVELETTMNDSMLSLHKAGQQAFASSPPHMTSQGPEAVTMPYDGFRPMNASYHAPSFAAFKKEMDAYSEQHMPAHSQGSQMGKGGISISKSKQKANHGIISGSSSGYGPMSSSASKPLFPSPRIGPMSWSEGKGASHQPVAPAQLTPAATSSPREAFFDNLFRQPPTTSAPGIAVQGPSPTKLPSSNKRRAPQAADELFGPALKGTRPDIKKATGLPTLPESSPVFQNFPGYTLALLTILLTWSHTMQSLYRRLPNPKTFPIHAAFPHRVTPPAYNHLISVGFYDTSVIPHKEIRFLGPGDAAEIGYAEVDVFRSKEEIAASEAQDQESCKIAAMKRKLGLLPGYGEPKDKVNIYQDQLHLANSGEGRWAYIVIKGHATSPEDDAPPHVMLAWHISAVTDTSTCLHTVFPDKDEPVLSHPLTISAPPKESLRRFASLQNLVSPSREQKNLHRGIRSVSSSADLPQEESDILPQEGALTLKRTVLKLEKAGSIPLIEGHRVDVKEFKGWLDAVGRGEGKVIIWRE
jgi:hypothetical protein